MEQAINSVNQSLLSYDISKHQLDTARDLLSKAHAELDILRAEKTNKIVVLEKQQYDGYSEYKTVSELKLNIEDPNISSTLLDIFQKVNTTELEKTIREKETTIHSLEQRMNAVNTAIENERKNSNKRVREIEEGKSEAIRKLKKGYEETILELEIDKETLAKGLADLKKDKTQVQIELARQEEIQQLQEKADALQSFKVKVEELSGNPIKLRKFLNGVQATAETLKNNPWIDKMWSRVYSATSTVENFVHMLKSVGKIEKETPVVKNCCDNYCTNCDCDYCYDHRDRNEW